VWSYMQLDLILNLGCSLGQNSFDQIIAIWNVIWMILNLCQSNLIILDAMVRSDCWDLKWIWPWWINKRDCLLMRHIKVIVVVDIDKDDEEKAVHVSLIMRVELLNRDFSLLKGKGKLGYSRHSIMWNVKD